MSDVPQSPPDRRSQAPLSEPIMELDLPAELDRLHAESTWRSGHSARTLIKHDDFRVVLIALGADARIAEHKADGRVSIHLLSGRTEIRTSARTFTLRSGGLLALDHGIAHDVHALEESALLLTIAWRRG
jgi:quercetin dioxygenase-like cupin family protein